MLPSPSIETVSASITYSPSLSIAGILSAAAGSGVAALLGAFTAGGFATTNFFTTIVSMILIGIVTAALFALLLGLFKRPELGDNWRWVRRARTTKSAE